MRKATTKLIELAEDGIISWETIARAALCYMSEDDVADMAECNCFFEDDEVDEEKEDRWNAHLSIESTNPDWCGKWLQREVEQEVEAIIPKGMHWLDYVLGMNFEELNMDDVATTLQYCTSASLHMKLNGDEVHISYENFPYAS